MNRREAIKSALFGISALFIPKSLLAIGDKKSITNRPYEQFFNNKIFYIYNNSKNITQCAYADAHSKYSIMTKSVILKIVGETPESIWFRNQDDLLNFNYDKTKDILFRKTSITSRLIQINGYKFEQNFVMYQHD